MTEIFEENDESNFHIFMTRTKVGGVVMTGIMIADAAYEAAATRLEARVVVDRPLATILGLAEEELNF